MKKRLLCYFVLLPIILLIAFTPVADIFSYVGWGALAVSIALILYAALKTKAFYRLKKVLLIALLFSSVCFYVGDAFSQTQWMSVQRQQQEAKKRCIEEFERLSEELKKLSEIPPINRTRDQEKEYEELVEKVTDLSEKCPQQQIETCDTVEELYKKAVNGCWACTMADLFLEAGDKVATAFYQKVSEKGYALALLAVGFLFWIMVKVVNLIMSLGTGDVGKFLSEFFVKMFLVGAIAIILKAPLRDTVDFFTTPFFVMTTVVTKNLNDIAMSAASKNQNIKIDEALAKEFGDNTVINCSYCDALKNQETTTMPEVDAISRVLKRQVKIEERAVSPMLRNSILCSICSINKLLVRSAD